MRGKKPLSENEVKSLRKLLEDKPLHSLLLNIGVDSMLCGSDLLNLKVSDLVTE
jgi:F0F1-type ATP synthase delta subunit